MNLITSEYWTCMKEAMTDSIFGQKSSGSLNSDVTSSREETNNIPEASVELMRLAIYTNSRL